MATGMPSITEPSGYVLELLRKGVDFTLYRGRQHGNPSPVLVVAPTAEQPSPQALKRLEHEYSLAAELDADWAARPLALTRHEGRTILVLKDPGGEPLDQVLQRELSGNQGQPFDLTRVLRIAIGLATALGQVHRRGLIHKDIKPANVLVDDAGKVWLTGFVIASRVPNERQAPIPVEIIAGTLAYMSPEQTGRMNRSIDTRSDLYSFGVTLYQMLTGALPFSAAAPLEWVHCHIARQPEPPGDRAAVPEPLSAIIIKLLAKNAEERYQTAPGLEADLRRCLAEWQSHGRIDPFPLGAYDSSDRLLIPEKLYGREREIDALRAAFDRVVAQGTPEFVLVSGYSGVGKSSVVNELHKVLVLPRGLFASGKFDQYKRDIPYATLAQAFQTLIRQILVKSAAEVSHWRHALQGALGPNGQLIIDLIPEVEFLIGKQPPVPELPPQDARNRFQLVFRRFLSTFARPEHPLALFLDDLQWLDAATLDLLEHLMTDPDLRYLMLVGAYRDNEVSSSHPLTRTLAAIREAGSRMQEIVLSPLGLDDVGRLVQDALHCEGDSGYPLAQLVHEKTGGNPFFSIQFLMALSEEGLLRRDPDVGAWIWDLARIRAHGYTDNVVDLMVEKLMRLSGTAQTALQQLACLGDVVEITTLALVFRESEEEIHTSLLEAVRTGLILRMEGAYAFLHDRIQEAAYALIPEAERPAAHLRIGRVLSHAADGLAEQLFDVANHFNRGAALLFDRGEKMHAAAIDLRAGRKAKASGAYASAREYFSAGMALLDETALDSQHELTFSLWLERAECDLLIGNFEEAEQLIMELLKRGASNVEFADASCLKIDLHVLKGELPQAVDSALTCLRLFGIDIPSRPTWEQVHAEYETVWQNLNGRPIESLIDLPLMTDPELQAAMQVLSVVTPATFFTNIHLFCLLVCRMANLSVHHGMSGACAHGYAHLSSILGTVFHRYSEGYRFAKLACDLVEKHGFIAYQAQAYTAMGVATHWTHSITTAIDFHRATTRAAIETGDLTYACYGTYLSLAGLHVRNDPLDTVYRETEMALDFVRKVGFRDVTDIIRSQQRFIATMQGRTSNFSTFSDGHFDGAAFEAQLTTDRMAMTVCFYWILKLKARFLSGDYAEAFAAARKAKPLLWASTGQVQLLDYFYFTALTVAALYENALADEQAGWRDLLAAHREQLREWAENYPPTFADKHLLVLAEIARVEGRAFDAMQLYEQAIQSAHEHGFVQNEAVAHEVAARFYSAHGFEMFAHVHLRNARNGYDRWGARGKVKQLDERYPHLREERDSSSVTSTIGTPVGQLDVDTVLKASQALSSEMVLTKLIEKLMRMAMEHAGAERGLLILLRDDEPRIEAEATTGHGRVEVTVRQDAITPMDLPQSVLQYVIRTRERVVLDDASDANLYSGDEYVRMKRARSVLCLPIVKQMKLVGALHLENNLTPRAFTADRVAVLDLLASQAAISLENASLYFDLHRSEAFLAQGQRISQTGSFGWNVLSGDIYWSEETYDIFEHDRTVKPTLQFVFQRIHPDDKDRVREALDQAINEETDFDFEHRLLMPEGGVKHLHALGRALKTSQGDLEFVGAVTDVTAAKQAEMKLRESEAYLAEAQRLSHSGSWAWNPATGENRYWSDECFRLMGFDPAGGMPPFETVARRFHPDDQPTFAAKLERARRDRAEFEVDYRIIHPGGEMKDIHAVGHPVFGPSGDLIEFVGSVIDVTERKRAEDHIRQSERELRQIVDFAPQQVAVVGPDLSRLYINQATLDYFGFTLEEWQKGDPGRFVHPDDRERLQRELQSRLLSALPFEVEFRLLRKDGKYRWFLYRWNPLRDEEGHVRRWYVAATDIEDRKQAEQRLENENVALREEIDKASMFEQIVGNSSPLRKVLSRVSKVAPTDSSVLITGETGTGKELVARAIHRRSRRSSHAFVSVNCAAIPRDLIASELFGHEKGAFTGATQRRLGRFELAEGGTIFLDEVGELPAETQIALLRVLQEREFERIGAAGSIRTNVRVIAATNRDLEGAIAAGSFRSDLFYRLNVFPIEMPSLRERREDIPLLVEYFIDRFARQAGKSFQAVNKKSLELLQSYPWPGNIRELQNVIERSVIVCETENFSVDESWLSQQPHGSEATSEIGLFQQLASQEKAIIEAALGECRGRVYGPSGAAAKLSMPRSTLEHKIRLLKIDKHRFKASGPSKNG
jgi:PAS domain S-box-containing protein